MARITVFSVQKVIFMLALSIVISVFTSCEKDSDGSPDVSAGEPQLTAVTPGEGAGGAVVTVTGSGMGQMRTIVFETNNVRATFQPNLNTESSILFRVPDTAVGGQQNIILTNVNGKTLTVPFKVVALPTISDVSNYNFITGSRIVLYGNNLNDVNKVVFTGTNTAATIISQTRKELVIEMPATTLSESKLDLTNASGTVTTTQVFVSLANNFVLYSDGWGPGAYGSGVQSWSWSTTVSEVTDVVKTGTKALKSEYTNGGLSLFMGSNWGTPQLNFTDFHVPYPSYLTFWAKAAGSTAVSLVIQPDGGAGTFNATGSTTISLPADGEWHYFKIPANFITGKFARLNIRVLTNATVYFDDILWIK